VLVPDVLVPDVLAAVRAATSGPSSSTFTVMTVARGLFWRCYPTDSAFPLSVA
jgi:hypothetical protein